MAQVKTGARLEAERVVDRYLKVIMSAQGDAGWEGGSLIGRLVDFKGDLPSSSGFSGFSKVWEQSRLLGQWPAKFLIAVRLMHSLTPRQREALCVDRAYRGRTKVIAEPWLSGLPKPVPNEVHWDDRSCADGLGCTVEAFRRRVSDAYQRLEGFALPQAKKAA